MLQRLPIVLAHLKAGSTSENLLMKYEINHIFFASRKRNY